MVWGMGGGVETGDSAWCDRGDDLDGGALGGGVIRMRGRGNELFVDLDRAGSLVEFQIAEQGRDRRLIGECARFTVDDDGHAASLGPLARRCGAKRSAHFDTMGMPGAWGNPLPSDWLRCGVY